MVRHICHLDIKEILEHLFNLEVLDTLDTLYILNIFKTVTVKHKQLTLFTKQQRNPHIFLPNMRLKFQEGQTKG